MGCCVVLQWSWPWRSPVRWDSAIMSRNSKGEWRLMISGRCGVIGCIGFETADEAPYWIGLVLAQFDKSCFITLNEIWKLSLVFISPALCPRFSNVVGSVIFLGAIVLGGLQVFLMYKLGKPILFTKCLLSNGKKIKPDGRRSKGNPSVERGNLGLDHKV